MRVLMVCLGNICRSPLAEGIMRKKIEENKLNWTVDSAGTSGYHIGEAPDPRSILIANQYGIDISSLKGRKFNYGDFEYFDLILVMDSMNYIDIIKQCINDHEKNKVHLIMNFVSPQKNISVPDPYYGGEEGFEEIYNMLNEACDQIILRHLSP